MFRIWMVEDENDSIAVLNCVFGIGNYELFQYWKFSDALNSLQSTHDPFDIYVFDYNLYKTWDEIDSRAVTSLKNNWDMKEAGKYLLSVAKKRIRPLNALLHTASGPKDLDIVEDLETGVRFMGKNFLEGTKPVDNSVVKNCMKEIASCKSGTQNSLKVLMNEVVIPISFPGNVSELKTRLGIQNLIITDACVDRLMSSEELYLKIECTTPDIYPKVYDAIFDAQMLILKEGKISREKIGCKLLTLSLSKPVEDSWWTEQIGNGWTAKSFFCRDGLYYEDFLLANAERLKKLLKASRYNLSTITSRALNLDGLYDVAHAQQYSGRTGVVSEVVGNQVKELLESIDLCPGSIKLPDSYLNVLSQLDEHVNKCNHYHPTPGVTCHVCVNLRMQLRTSVDQVVKSFAEEFGFSIIKRTLSTAYITLFFPLNQMIKDKRNTFKDVMCNILKYIRTKNNNTTYYVTYELTKQEICEPGRKLLIRSVWLIIGDNGTPFPSYGSPSSLYDTHSLSKCTCGDLIIESDYAYISDFYMGSRINDKWEWIKYSDKKSDLDLPDKIRYFTSNPQLADVVNKYNINNLYLFRMDTYEHVPL